MGQVPMSERTILRWGWGYLGIMFASTAFRFTTGHGLGLGGADMAETWTPHRLLASARRQK